MAPGLKHEDIKVTINTVVIPQPDDNKVSKTICDGLNSICTTCYGIRYIISDCCYCIYRSIVDFFTTIFKCISRIYIKRKTYFYSLIILCICSLAIFLGVFLGIVLKDIEHVNTYFPTTCTYRDNVVSKFTCCDKVDCQCNSYNGSISCSTSIFQLTPALSCGDGYYCCKTTCKTCTRPIVIPCGKRICSTIKKYDCECDTCVQSTPNRLCSVKCGTCYNVYTSYDYLTSSSNASYTILQNCSRDDEGCLNSWIARHQVNSSVECWYDTNYPNNGAFFEKPSYEYNKAGIPVTIVFGSISIILLVVSISLLRCR